MVDLVYQRGRPGTSVPLRATVNVKPRIVGAVGLISEVVVASYAAVVAAFPSLPCGTVL
jgi:hypothetical protein